MKKINPWGDVKNKNKTKKGLPPAQYGRAKYGNSRVGANRPGSRGK